MTSTRLEVHIRRALLEEAEALTALIMRAKSSWGYDQSLQNVDYLCSQTSTNRRGSPHVLVRRWPAPSESMHRLPWQLLVEPFCRSQSG
jgi:hypothetical protein